MKKSDLETGDMLVTEDGTKLLVLLNTRDYNTDVVLTSDGYMGLDTWDENLKTTRNYGETYWKQDIVEVYHPKSFGLGLNGVLDGRQHKLFWKRPKPKEFVFLSQQTYLGESGEDVADAEGVIFDALTIDEAIATLKDMKDED